MAKKTIALATNAMNQIRRCLTTVPKTKTSVPDQIDSVKAKYPDFLYATQIGKFFEFFGQQGETVGKILGFKTARRGSDSFTGIPFDTFDENIKKVLSHGHRICVIEQQEPSEKGILPRCVTRLLTPGTFYDFDDEYQPSVTLVSLSFSKNDVGVCAYDVGTGEVRQFLTDDVKAISLIQSLNPSEIIIPSGDDLGILSSRAVYNPDKQLAVNQGFNLFLGNQEEGPDCLVSFVSGDQLTDADLNKILTTKDLTSVEREAVRNAVQYVRMTSLDDEIPFKFVDKEKKKVRYGTRVVENLNLMNTSVSRSKNTLYHLWKDEVRTMSARMMLRRRFARTTTNPTRIRTRLAFVDFLLRGESESTRICLTDVIKGINGSLENTIRKIEVSSAANLNSKNLDLVEKWVSCGKKVSKLTPSNEMGFVSLLQSPEFDEVWDLGKFLQDSRVKSSSFSLESKLHDDITFIGKQGKAGHADMISILTKLENYKSRIGSGLDKIFQPTSWNLERDPLSREFYFKTSVTKQKSFIAELNLTENPAEVNATALRRPSKSKRYLFSAELQTLSEALILAEDSVEPHLLDFLREFKSKIESLSARLSTLDHIMSSIDIGLACAKFVETRNYCMPTVLEGKEAVCKIKEGRHPVIMTDNFIPNSICLGGESSLVTLVTGPNMGGKSTLLKMIGLFFVMAQAGFPVPAKEFEFTPVDAIFCRMGSHDDLFLGKSTFRVEMEELAEAVNTSTSRSLMLLDEVGRGTSVQDGLSLAAASLNHIEQEIGCMALFATHYHNIEEYLSPEARKELKKVHFGYENGMPTHRLKDGIASNSYGIAAAEYAGLPPLIIKEATVILENYK